MQYALRLPCLALALEDFYTRIKKQKHFSYSHSNAYLPDY